MNRQREKKTKKLGKKSRKRKEGIRREIKVLNLIIDRRKNYVNSRNKKRSRIVNNKMIISKVSRVKDSI